MKDDFGSNPVPPPDDWKSAAQMRNDGHGAFYTLEHRLKAIRGELIENAENRGLSETEAIAHVEEHHVRSHRPKRGSVAALYASPGTWELILQQKPPQATANWKSYVHLENEGYPGGGAVIRRLKQARDTLIRDLMAAGFNEDESRDLIETHLIGHRRFDNGKFDGVLSASTDAIGMLERDGILRKPARPGRDGDIPPSDPVAKLLLEATELLSQRGDNRKADRFLRLIAKEFRGTAEAQRAAESSNLHISK
jgi:hypothetical protein